MEPFARGEKCLPLQQELIKYRISAGHSGSFSALRVNGGRNAATILSLR